MMKRKFLVWVVFGLLILACNFGIESPTPEVNLLATLAASTPLGGNLPPANETPPSPSATSAFNFPTPVPPSPTLFAPQLTSSDVNPPAGKIVFTCQLFKVQATNQICIMNADGSGYRRLTTDDSKQHYYPSLAPDGKSVIYAKFREANYFDFYEMNLATGEEKLITKKKVGNINAPEISPDGKYIVYKMWNANLSIDALYIMERNGENRERFLKIPGWDPTWSPDGKYILFASNVDGATQLYTARIDGKNIHRVSSLPAIRGRSDWSPDGRFIATYSGEPWQREVYLMNADGSGARVISPPGGNAQGPSFSPDSQWVAFTAYYDHYGDEHGCEIYIIRVDGTDLRRLTNNDYCDYQPRWGP